MASHIAIADSAELTDSNIDANNVVISEGAKLNKVHIKARNVRIGAVSSLENCKLFSRKQLCSALPILYKYNKECCDRE